MEITDRFALVDQVLDGFSGALGANLSAYKNHIYRVLNYYLDLRQQREPESRFVPDSVLIAAAFHDLGVWVHGTFDYIEPSVELAKAHLAEHGLSALHSEVEGIIRYHHKLSPFRGSPQSSDAIETFRRADLVDVSSGLIARGLPRTRIAEVKAVFPDLGFHRQLLNLTLNQFCQAPLRPLPMVCW
jgi:hypothetical protein